MSFDHLAPVYRLMETVSAGGKMHRCRCAFLEKIPAPRRVLILGEGPGRFLAECLVRFPKAHITCVDSSANMIAQARKNLVRHGLDGTGVEFVHQDVLHWHPQRADHDLIATHFFLDCFRPEQLERLVPVIARASAEAPEAHWLLADFQEAARGWRRWRSRAILSLLYAFFRVATRLPASRLTPPDALIQRKGFLLRDAMETEWGLLRSQWWVRRQA